jgi:hypothetical protein
VNLWELTAGIRAKLVQPAVYFALFCAGGLLAHCLEAC